MNAFRITAQCQRPVCLGARLALGACTVTLLLYKSLPPPEIMSLACTSRCGQRSIECAWPSCMASLASFCRAVCLPAPLALLDCQSCGCDFVRSTATASRAHGARLWRALSGTQLSRVYNVKFIVYDEKLSSCSHMEVGNSGEQIPVLLTNTVADLNNSYSLKTGLPVGSFVLARVDSRRLAHDSALLAMYVWDLLGTSHRDLQIHLSALPWSSQLATCRASRYYANG